RPVDSRHLHSFPTRRSSDLLGKIQVLPVAGGVVQAQAGGDHAPVDVVPLVGLAAAHLFDVPHGGLGAGMGDQVVHVLAQHGQNLDRKSTRLNSSHVSISYAV